MPHFSQFTVRMEEKVIPQNEHHHEEITVSEVADHLCYHCLYRMQRCLIL